MFSQGYVGVSSNFEQRLISHKKRTNRYLQFAITKYGWDNLIKQQLLIGSKEYCLSIEKQLRPIDAVGWNIVMGGGMPPKSKKGMNLGKAAWNKGLSCSDEAKQKISAGVSKLWENPEYRQAMSDVHKGQTSPMAGKKHSLETLIQMKEVKLGKPSGKLGFKYSEDAKKKIKELAYSEKWTCVHCNKTGLGKGAGNRWHFDKCRNKEQI